MNERSIFLEALDKGDPGARSAFLDAACAGDPALRQRVEALLESHAEARNFLGKLAPARVAEELALLPAGGQTQGETPANDKAGAELGFLTPADKPGVLGRLGHYEVHEVIGRGGMGVVLKALDEKLHRVVAIKVMASPPAGGAAARKRFTREAQAAAAVRNDHIIAIHAVEEANGLPYLVMEYISGVSLQERLDRTGPLELKEILRIGLQTAAGLAAAHAQGLIHRDVKPANILLENGVERVKLTDFGLARAVDDASLTQSGVVAGTPQYMAPEQARGEAVDHRADLFSLGSVLYAMCTGRPPFRAQGIMAVLKRVCEEAPRLIPEINPEIPGWLVALIARLHAKDPAQRFQSAAEVAGLLGYHLARLQQPPPVPDDPQPTLKLPRRRGWRRPVAAALIVLACGLGLGEATGVTRLAGTVLRVFGSEGILVVEVDDPEVKVTIEGDGGLVLTGAGPQEVRLRPGRYRLAAAKEGKPARQEIVTISRGDRQVVKVSLEPAGPSQTKAPFQFSPPPLGPLDRLEAAQIPAAERFDGQPKELVAVLGEHRQRHWGAVRSVAWSTDGKQIASGGDDDVIRVWDAQTMRERAVLRGHTREVMSVVFSPDGRRILSGGMDETVRWWEAETGQELRRFQGHGQVDGVALSPDGRRALSGHHDRTLRLWDLETGAELRHFDGHTSTVAAVAFSPDGRRAVSGVSDNTVRLWDVESGKQLHRLQGHTGQVCAVAISPDGRLALSGNSHWVKNGLGGHASDYDLRLWELDSGKELRRFKGHTNAVGGVSFSPDGRHALSCSRDGTLRWWEVQTGRMLHRFEGPGEPLLCAAISPNGRLAVSGGEDGTLRLWDVASGKELRPVAGPTYPAYQVTFSRDGGHLLAAGGDRIVRLWDTARGKELRCFRGHSDPVVSVALSPDGRRALSASRALSWAEPQPLDGDRIGPWRLWDVETGKEIRRFYGPPTGEGGGAAYSPDGKRCLTSCQRRLLLWDVESARELRGLEGHTNRVTSVAFSPDGRRALSGGHDHTVRLWDIDNGTELRCLRGHTGAITAVAFSPDGRHGVSGSSDGTVRLWDLAAEQAPGQVFFKWHTDGVSSVAFGPDGQTLASAGYDSLVILWDVAVGDRRREWQLPGPVHGVAFAADGRHLATANGNGTVYILRLPKP
jgi:WD40 repeat protein